MSSDTKVVQNESGQTSDGIEDLEAPNVAKTALLDMQREQEAEPQIICERVRPTGSILPTKVCRHVTDIERKTEYDQDMFKDIKDNTALGNARL